MNYRFLKTLALVALCALTLVGTIQVGQAKPAGRPALSNSTGIAFVQSTYNDQVASTTCALRPPKRPANGPLRIATYTAPVALNRFRQEDQKTSLDKTSERAQAASPGYSPKELVYLAHPTNYGLRYVQDWYGKPAEHEAIVVLHETVGSAAGTINSFQENHPWGDDQVSYHTLIDRDGAIIYLVPPDKRAFGAGDSVFNGSQGVETVRTNPELPPSVNNFAYHISLVTPADGRHNGRNHSGYTMAQYQSLAWLVSRTGVPRDRITTHKDVDQSGQRIDPRSFNQQQFISLLNQYPRSQEISIQCSPPLVE